MSIVTRAQWGAEYGTGDADPGPEGNVVIHHSYSPALPPTATAEEEMLAWAGIERFHKVSNGWDGIGYNFGVAPSGRVYEGRGWKFRGAHAGEINGDSIGVCLLINGIVTPPNQRMIQVVRELISLGLKLGEIASDYTVSGHRDHMNRTCPGDLVYARLQEFRHDYIAKVPDQVNARIWSNYFEDYLVVTRYVSDKEWYFFTQKELSAGGLVEHKAVTPLSKMTYK